jgi:Reverse transcriptase (RNA-dependent DNA polymerase).
MSTNIFDRFARRGIFPAQRRSSTASSGRRPFRPYTIDDANNFNINRFSSPPNLFYAYRQLVSQGGHGAGVDGFRPEHFSSYELWNVIRSVRQSLVVANYRPYPPRIVRIPRSDNRFRELSLQNFPDRMVAKALVICLTPFWETRIRRLNHWEIFAWMCFEVNHRGRFILGIDDIRNCFPSAPLEEIANCHRIWIENPVLLRLIDSIICDHEGYNNRRIGLNQGSPYSSIAMEVLLHHHLDREWDCRSSPTQLFRYVDNLTFLSDSVSECQGAVNAAGNSLGRIGMHLKGQDGQPQDLRSNHSMQVLGLIPRYRRGTLDFDIPESAFDEFRTGLQAVNEAPHPSMKAVGRCIGWIQSAGPALTTSEARHRVVRRILDLACQEGFRSISRSRLLNEATRSFYRWREVVVNTERQALSA